MPPIKNDELCQAHQQKQTINLLFKNNTIRKHMHRKHFNVVSTLSFRWFYVATLDNVKSTLNNVVFFNVGIYKAEQRWYGVTQR